MTTRRHRPHDDERRRRRIDPRIRERRIEVHREAGRRRLRDHCWSSRSAIVASGSRTSRSTRRSSTSTTSAVTGAHQRSRRPRCATPRGVHIGDALLFVDTGAVARRVEQLPWVEHATVHARLPGHVAIAITEYTPTAFVRRSRRQCRARRVERSASSRACRTARRRASRSAACATRPRSATLLSPPDAAGVVRQLPRRARTRRSRAIDVGGDGVALRRCASGGGRCGSATLDRSRTPKGSPRSRCSTHLGAAAVRLHRRVDAAGAGLAR